MSETCRVIITEEPPSLRYPHGLVNVSAPMKYKELCYDILDDARRVIDCTPEHAFTNPGKTLLITMNNTGMVDVQAPLPSRHWCEHVLKTARTIIEEFDDGDAKMRPAGYADSLPSP